MSLSKTESPIAKVIFLQKIFRFSGRTVKDLVIINSVCKDFEETMQAHHTFNLVLYDNIIKKRHDEKDFLNRSFDLLSTAPAWIVYQWTTVNEHDETQRELLKKLLLYQSQNYHKILIRNHRHIESKDPATTHQLLRHILDSCVKLGIAKEVLEGSNAGGNCVSIAAGFQFPADLMKLLLDYCEQNADIKNILERRDSCRWNCFIQASANQLAVDSFKLLLDRAMQHADGKTMLEQRDNDGCNAIMYAAANNFPFDSFKLLLEFTSQHADLKQQLEQRDCNDYNCLIYAVQSSALPTDSLRLLIAHFPSNESFQLAMSVKNNEKKTAIDVATEEIMQAFLQDPDCWQKCREWLVSATTES